ncbi:MAG: hypothetical protein GXO54_05955 [Chloroflexi bacterium]|nr:hypothetical protein [Chloroflexota bacterium]
MAWRGGRVPWRRGWHGLVAGLLALLMWGAARWTARTIFEDWPHLEDEVAYWWQAQAASRGALYVPSPPQPHLFLVPFVIDDAQGRRFGKYPPGWPVVLAMGMRLGRAAWVNPSLASVAILLVYWIGRRLDGPALGLLSATLALTSPFVWLNSGSLLSHPLAWVLSLALTWAWVVVATAPEAQGRAWLWGAAGISGLAGAALLLTRPWTGVALLAVLGPGWVLLAWRRPNLRVAIASMMALWGLGVALYLTWQYILTGSPWRSPYTLWWPYDRVGFGPGHGVLPEGHNLDQAWINTKFSLQVGMADILGWYRWSWLLLPVGLIMAGRRTAAWPVILAFPALVLFYMAYWVGAWLFGPRYYYEGVHSWFILTAWGVLGLLRALTRLPRPRLRRGALALLAAGLFALVWANLRYYLPGRLAMMYDLYGMSPRRVRVFLRPEAQALTPALVFVQDVTRWMDYAVYVPLQDPWLQTPWVFAIDPGRWSARRALAQAFPGRTRLLYAPKQDPWRLAVWVEPGDRSRASP